MTKTPPDRTVPTITRSHWNQLNCTTHNIYKRNKQCRKAARHCGCDVTYIVNGPLKSTQAGVQCWSVSLTKGIKEVTCLLEWARPPPLQCMKSSPMDEPKSDIQAHIGNKNTHRRRLGCPVTSLGVPPWRASQMPHFLSPSKRHKKKQAVTIVLSN